MQKRVPIVAADVEDAPPFERTVAANQAKPALLAKAPYIARMAKRDRLVALHRSGLPRHNVTIL